MTFSIVKRWKNASEAVKLFLTVLIGGALLWFTVTFTYYVALVIGGLLLAGAAILFLWVLLYMAWSLLVIAFHIVGSLFD